jgi:hypothetical protein
LSNLFTTISFDPFFCTEPSCGSIGANMLGGNIEIPNLVANMYGESSTVVAPPIQGGYTSLLFGLHQDVSAARKLDFDESSNPPTF